jgi:hypothetical protein
LRYVHLLLVARFGEGERSADREQGLGGRARMGVVAGGGDEDGVALDAVDAVAVGVDKVVVGKIDRNTATVGWNHVAKRVAGGIKRERTIGSDRRVGLCVGCVSCGVALWGRGI